MKASYQKLSLDLTRNLYQDFWVRSDYFGFHWHYHPEIEICYVKKGFGQRIVGESIERFVEGDLVLLGSNLPHSWISDTTFNESPDQMEVYVVHVDAKRMNHILALQEFEELDVFLKKSSSGIAFHVENEPHLLQQLISFELADGLSKSLHFLNLLERLSSSATQRQLCPTTYIPETGKYVEDRIQKVCQYIHANYRKRIKLDELALIAHMNSSAFCRFFKKVIGKTPIGYINELRINTASHELLVSDKSVNQVALDTGFQSLSQFNKLFKIYNHTTPSTYRKALPK